MVKVLRSGVYTTVQDLGRVDYQPFGVPQSGVMDTRAAKLANALVGNNEGEAVLEITMSGPTLEFQIDTIIAITGADLNPTLNTIKVSNNHVITVRKGDVLSFGTLVSGFRSYLAVLGGFQTKVILGSKSMYKGVTLQSTIKKGDFFKVNNNNVTHQNHFSGLKVDNSYLESKTLDVLMGPEFDNLTERQKEVLFSKPFKISKDNNRMAYQLEEHLENDFPPIITSPVLPGTVQLTPSGKIIVLMRDCQTTGGYPRILQLTELAINTLAQKYTGNYIDFTLKG